MTDLRTQMRTYLEDTSLPVDVDELISDLTDTGHTVLLPFELAPIRRTRPALVVVVVSLLTLLVIGAFGITGLLGSDDPDVIDSPPTVVTSLPVTTVTTPTTETSVTTAPTESTVITSDDRGISPTHTITQPDSWVAAIAIHEGTLWAFFDSNDKVGLREGQILRIDPETGDALSSIDLGEVPAWSFPRIAIEAGEGALWVTWNNLLLRIDPATQTVETVLDNLVPGGEDATSRISGGSGRLAVGEGAVWLLDGQSSLIRIDPTSNTVSHTIELENKLWSVEVGAGSVWVLVEAEPDPTDDPIAGRVPEYSRLLRIDPETLEVTSSMRISDVWLPRFSGKALAFGEGALWITEVGYLTRIDPDSNSIAASIPVPGEGCGPLAIGFGGGKVWTTKSGPWLVAIDPDTNEPTAAVWIQEHGAIFNIAGTDDALWITSVSVLQRVSIADIPSGVTTAATPCA